MEGLVAATVATMASLEAEVMHYTMCEAAQWHISSTGTTLMKLEMRRLVRAFPGFRYARR